MTERVLAEAREALGDAVPAPLMMPRPASMSQPAEECPSEDTSDPRSPEGQLTLLLGRDGDRLLMAWRALAGRTSGLKPSESLALAERELEDSSGNAA